MGSPLSRWQHCSVAFPRTCASKWANNNVIPSSAAVAAGVASARRRRVDTDATVQSRPQWWAVVGGDGTAAALCVGPELSTTEDERRCGRGLARRRGRRTGSGMRPTVVWTAAALLLLLTVTGTTAKQKIKLGQWRSCRLGWKRGDSWACSRLDGILGIYFSGSTRAN